MTAVIYFRRALAVVNDIILKKLSIPVVDLRDWSLITQESPFAGRSMAIISHPNILYDHPLALYKLFEYV